MKLESKSGCEEFKYLIERGDEMAEQENTILSDDLKFLNLIEQAHECREKNQYKKEYVLLQQALEIKPDDMDILLKLGRVNRILGNYDEALNYYNRALVINPNDGVLYCNLGAVYIYTGKLDKACYSYEKGLAMVDPDYQDYPIILGGYAMALGKNGEKKKAFKVLKRARKMGYKNAEVIKKEGNLHFWNRFFNW